MSSLLVLTTLDYGREPNQRVHHQVRHIAPAFANTTVLYLARAKADRSWRGYARSMLGLQTRYRQEGAVTFVEVDPLWNLPWGSTVRYIRFLSVLVFVPVSLVLGHLCRVRKAFDVVLAVGPYAGAAGYFLKKLGLAKVLVYDDIDYEPGLVRRSLLAGYVGWMERFFMARADVRVSVGDVLAELRRAQGIGEVVVITNGVDYRDFAVAQSKVEHPPTLIYTGNLARQYSGLEVAIRAVPRIARSCPDARLLIIGGGDPGEERALRSLTRGLGVETRVHMVGVRRYEELPEYLRQADLGWAVFPPNGARLYAFPNKAMEYMAAGLGILGTVGSQTARLIERFDCGLVVPFDVDAVAEAVVALFDNRSRLAEYARNGGRAAAAFDWPDLMSQQRSIILSKLGRSQPPPDTTSCRQGENAATADRPKGTDSR